jgi:hypothetical protein
VCLSAACVLCFSLEYLKALAPIQIDIVVGCFTGRQYIGPLRIYLDNVAQHNMWYVPLELYLSQCPFHH